MGLLEVVCLDSRVIARGNQTFKPQSSLFVCFAGTGTVRTVFFPETESRTGTVCTAYRGNLSLDEPC